MGDIVFNQAKGRTAHYGSQAGVGNAALILIPLEASGLVADSVMEDYDTVADILAGATNEQGGGANRKTITSVTVTVDDTNNRVDIDCANQVWAGLTGNAVGALVFAYDADTTAGTDANLTPMTKHDFAVTPDGTDVTATVDPAFARAA